MVCGIWYQSDKKIEIVLIKKGGFKISQLKTYVQSAMFKKKEEK